MKKQLLALLASAPLAIEKTWLKTLLDTIQSVGDTKNLDSEILKALVVDPGTSAGEGTRATVRDGIGIVALSGPIFPKPNILTEWLGIGTPLDKFMSDVKALQEDPLIDSTLIVVDSPGGAITGINEAANLLTAWGKTKPINSYVTGANASAAYWLTSAAGKIFADATARVGSIGVLATFYKGDSEDTIEIVNTASPKKALKADTKEGQAEILNTINAIADVFIASVAKGRGVSEEVVTSQFGQGGVLVGAEAESVKMIDGLSSFEEVISKYSTEDVANYSNSLKGESNMELNLDLLKAKFPDVYQAACDEATAPLQATITKKNEVIKGLEETVVSLEAKLEASETTANNLSERVTKLEREGEIQKAKAAEVALKSQAGNIATEVLNASSLPPRLHSKIAKVVDFNAHVGEDGVLNQDTYRASLKAEAEEWASAMDVSDNDTTLSGLTTGPSDPDSKADDDVVDRMLGHAGVTIQ